MVQNNILELERLANQPQLVAPIEYSNSQRDKQIFYDFVRAYVTKLGMSINEIKFSLPEDVKQSFGNIAPCYKSKDTPILDKCRVITGNILSVILMPLLYPLVGGNWGMRVDGNDIDIAIPKWDGAKPWLLDGKVHEYLHAYNAAMARDFTEKELITINGFYDIPFEMITPRPKKAPTYDDLKKFERRVIQKVVQRQKKDN